ncbi:MAG: hypothetical protein WDK95_17310 [Syntrophorhabdaceae bacterium]
MKLSKLKSKEEKEGDGSRNEEHLIEVFKSGLFFGSIFGILFSLFIIAAQNKGYIFVGIILIVGILYYFWIFNLIQKTKENKPVKHVVLDWLNDNEHHEKIILLISISILIYLLLNQFLF